MNVSKEERRIEIAALRDSEFSYCGEHAETVRNLVNYLCDALEQADAERDALIEPLLLVRCCPDKDISVCINDGFTAHKEIGRCRLCWLEWAQHEDSKGEDPR